MIEVLFSMTSLTKKDEKCLTGQLFFLGVNSSRYIPLHTEVTSSEGVAFRATLLHMQK
jgi:hypothetical protein